MKIKSVESLLKQTKYIALYDDDDKCQWVSNGRAYYPLRNMPWLDEESIFTMLDVPADKREKYIFHHFDKLPTILDFSDIIHGERLFDRDLIMLSMDGNEIEPLKPSSGVVFLDTQYLKPFADERSVELYERKNESTGTYIAVKSGLLLLGLIKPAPILNETFVEMLNDLLDLSAYEWQKQKQAQEAGTWSEQTSLYEDDNESEADNEDDHHV